MAATAASLSSDGEGEQALQGMFWGALFGSRTDAFGVRRMIRSEKPKTASSIRRWRAQATKRPPGVRLVA